MWFAIHWSPELSKLTTEPMHDADAILIENKMLSVELLVADERWLATMQAGQVTALLDQIAEKFTEPLGSANVLLSNDAHVAKLNGQFRQKNEPTNVLSFPDGDGMRLGDIILAHETCAQEAKRDDKAFGDHFIHLILHGMLHLLGFDHTNAKNACEMELLEREILAGLGIPDPYDDETFELS